MWEMAASLIVLLLLASFALPARSVHGSVDASPLQRRFARLPVRRHDEHDHGGGMPLGRAHFLDTGTAYAISQEGASVRTRRQRVLVDDGGSGSGSPGSTNFSFRRGVEGRVMGTPITVYLIWYGTWEEPSKAVVRTAFRSLTPDSVTQNHTSGPDADLPTLERWWEIVRQYQGPDHVPVTNNVTLGAECVYNESGSGGNVTDANVTAVVALAFQSPGSLNCTLPQQEDAVYYIVFSRDMQFAYDALGGALSCSCSGAYTLWLDQGPRLRLLWSKMPAVGDFCNFWSQWQALLSPPNADSGLDTLVSSMLGQLAETATAFDGEGWLTQDNRTIRQVCPWPIINPDPSSRPVVDDNQVSFNLVGIHGSRFLVQQLWSVEHGNCMLQMLPDACDGTVIVTDAQRTIQKGLIVAGKFGLQPYSPNLRCSWIVNVTQAKFIHFWLDFLAVPPDNPVNILSDTASCSDNPNNLGHREANLLSNAASWTAGQHSRKLLAFADQLNATSPFASGCSSQFGGFLYDQRPVDAVVEDNAMLITFNSRSVVSPRANGFILKYEAGFCQGQEVINSKTGNISDGSPDGQVYGRGLFCSWLLLGKPHTPVLLRFSRINTSSSKDTVAVYSGRAIIPSSTPIQTFSGNFTNPPPQIATEGPMLVVFSTKTGGGLGWEASFVISSPDKLPGRHHTSREALIAGITASILGVAFVLVVGTVLCCSNRRIQQRGHVKCSVGRLGIGRETLFLLNRNKRSVFPVAEISRATGGFNQANLLSRGRAGQMYRGVLADGRLVTVKQSPSMDFNSANRELEVLAGLKHSNVVQLVGYSPDPIGRLLVFHHPENGSLRDALIGPLSQREPITGSQGRNSKLLLSWELRLNIALEVARGLEYLHIFADPCVIHRDLKSRNILLDKCWAPRISGFHLAVFCATGDQVELFADPRWVPTSNHFPGSPLSRGQSTGTIQVSKAGDIFGFGVIVLEILTGRQLLETGTFNSGHTRSHLVARAVPLIEHGQGLSILDPRLPVPEKPEVLLKLAEMAVWCVNPATTARPTVVEVVKALEQLMKMFHAGKSITRNPKLDPNRVHMSIASPYDGPPRL